MNRLTWPRHLLTTRSNCAGKWIGTDTHRSECLHSSNKPPHHWNCWPSFMLYRALPFWPSFSPPHMSCLTMIRIQPLQDKPLTLFLPLNHIIIVYWTVRTIIKKNTKKNNEITIRFCVNVNGHERKSDWQKSNTIGTTSLHSLAV